MPFATNQPSTSPAVNGCYYPPEPPPPSGGNQQWLFPVMSPSSEGLIYKPHPGMGHTGPSVEGIMVICLHHCHGWWSASSVSPGHGISILWLGPVGCCMIHKGVMGQGVSRGDCGIQAVGRSGRMMETRQKDKEKEKETGKDLAQGNARLRSVMLTRDHRLAMVDPDGSSEESDLLEPSHGLGQNRETLHGLGWAVWASSHGRVWDDVIDGLDHIRTGRPCVVQSVLDVLIDVLMVAVCLVTDWIRPGPWKC
ncbi:hypothetical protein Bca52824_035230 [Brassica carinata]|uniref:Uncharacterized protein n=1 Tax=Brassica carinata TaxID=52824 RepID=A0A8X7S3V4_BRACI|nr:hypothetical protein Bca52824_035230 [Brassica carinata]